MIEYNAGESEQKQCSEHREVDTLTKMENTYFDIENDRYL